MYLRNFIPMNEYSSYYGLKHFYHTLNNVATFFTKIFLLLYGSNFNNMNLKEKTIKV